MMEEWEQSNLYPQNSKTSFTIKVTAVTVNQSGPAVHTNTILSFALKKNRT
jgi:hypothetical protein